MPWSFTTLGEMGRTEWGVGVGKRGWGGLAEQPGCCLGVVVGQGGWALREERAILEGPQFCTENGDISAVRSSFQDKLASGQPSCAHGKSFCCPRKAQEGTGGNNAPTSTRHRALGSDPVEVEASRQGLRAAALSMVPWQRDLLQQHRWLQTGGASLSSCSFLSCIVFFSGAPPG